MISEIEAENAEFVCRLMNSDGYLRYIGDRGIRTPEQAADYIEQVIRKSYHTHGYGMWLVSERESRSPVGMAGLVNRDWLDDIDVGYAFLPEVSGRGYATESSAAVLSYAAEQLGISRVVAITAVDNDASARVLEKLGYCLQERIEFPGDPQGAKLYVPQR